MNKFLLTTALVAATMGTAVAQEATSDTLFRAQADPAEIHASDFIGMRIYRADAEVGDGIDGIQDGWDDIGEVGDVILTRDGQIEAVLVDIGGFLGIGENRVAVDMGAIDFVSDDSTPDDESDFFLVMNAPRGALEQASAYGAAEMPEQTEMSAGTAAPEADAAASESAQTVDAGASDQPAGEMATATPDRMPLARDGYAPFAQAELTAERLTGAPVFDTADKRIGEVSELLLNDDGTVRAAVIDVGGFLGIGEKPVEMGLDEIDILRSDDGSDVRVYVPMSKEDMEAKPTYAG